MNHLKEKFMYVIEGRDSTLIKNLEVDHADIIQNADGEVDCPLDRVLRKNKMEIKDLFELKVHQVKLIMDTGTRQTILNSICFEHLVG